MELLDALHEEHGRIEAVVGALRTYVLLRARGEGDRDDAARFLGFLRRYAGAFHHEREEHVLFPALVEHTHLPTTRGPVAALVAQHRELEGLLAELGPLLLGPLEDAGARRLAVALAHRYAGGLEVHIDVEESELLPESEARLRRCGILELAARGPTAEELAALEDGLALVRRYPPTADASVVRGEGCVVCPSFGVLCDGVETEWWTEQEREEFPDHL